MSALPQPGTAARESLIVLSRDAALVETLQVLEHDHDVYTVGDETELAARLIPEHAGVAILDAEASSGPIERLTDRLRAQFPDLVLIVAGRIDDQSALAAQITSGTVYRFLHKPVSEQRVRLFVEAAWRRHGQEHEVLADTINSPALGVRRLILRPAALATGGAVLGGLALLAVWLALRRPEPVPHPRTAAAELAEAPTARDEVLEGLLAKADQALAAGHLVTPPGASAADLFRQALRRNANDPRANSGLEKIIDRLLTAAEGQLLSQHLEEARRLTDQARAIKPDHVRVAFLSAQIAKEGERAVLSQARQAAASGRIGDALAVLDGATPQTGRSPLVAEARRELQKKEIDGKVADYLGKAAERTRRDALVEPAQDNARFFIESARAIAPNDTNVRQAERQLADRLVAEARKSLAAGDADQAHRWIQAAAETGVSRDDIASMTREEQRVRTAARADAMARLALLFNQRLSQGRVLDPAGDSAKFYLTQLTRSDAAHPSTVLARQAFAARALSEARGAARRQDAADARRWLAEARDAGADEAAIGAVDHDIASAQQPGSGTGEVVPASSLKFTHYVPPAFPESARERGLSGWVDVQFTIRGDGSTTDVSILGAEPVGVFEPSALDAVRKWRYQPSTRDGKPLEPHVRLRLRFALEP